MLLLSLGVVAAFESTDEHGLLQTLTTRSAHSTEHKGLSHLEDLIKRKRVASASEKTAAQEKGFTMGFDRRPLNMPGQRGSRIATGGGATECRDRCAGVDGCCYFTFFFNTRKCHLQACGTRLFPRDDRVTTGSSSPDLIDCFRTARKREPNMLGPREVIRSSARTALECQEHCAGTDGCCHFTISGKTCTLQDCDAKEVDASPSFTTGPKTCNAQALEAMPKLGTSANLVTDADSCVANSGPCQFPFTYKNLTFYRCSWVDRLPHWCATESEPNGPSVGNHNNVCKSQKSCTSVVARSFTAWRRVTGLYTFAFSAVTEKELFDGQNPVDGSFAGLRAWMKNENGEVDFFSKPVVHLRTPRMKAVQLNSMTNTAPVRNLVLPGSCDRGKWSNCSGTVTFPIRSATTQEWAASREISKFPKDFKTCLGFVCHVESYFIDYKNTDYPFLDTYFRFAMDTSEHWSLDSSRQYATDIGWTLESALKIRAEYSSGTDQDNVFLYRRKSDQLCVISFEGSDEFFEGINDWVSNINMFGTDFCGFRQAGFGGTHRGYVAELRNIIRRTEYQTEIKAKLPSCTAVHVTGHSKGAGLANIFSGCANRESVADMTPEAMNDYALVSWERER